MTMNQIEGPSFWQRLRIAGMFLFLGPLMVILGTIDIVRNGRSRNSPLEEQPRDKDGPQ